MSNHPSLTGTSDNDFVTNDDELARVFEFSFQPPVYPLHAGRNGLTTIPSDDLGQHPITEEVGQGVVFNNSCRIALPETASATVLAYLPGESDSNLDGRQRPMVDEFGA